MVKKEYVSDHNLCKVTFSFPSEEAKDAREVKILGEFNNWDRDKAVRMTLKQDTYNAVVELQPGKSYQFRYLIDSHRWKNEANADGFVSTSYGMTNSLIEL